jgi:hypothetical protein
MTTSTKVKRSREPGPAMMSVAMAVCFEWKTTKQVRLLSGVKCHREVAKKLFHLERRGMVESRASCSVPYMNEVRWIVGCCTRVAYYTAQSPGRGKKQMEEGLKDKYGEQWLTWAKWSRGRVLARAKSASLTGWERWAKNKSKLMHSRPTRGRTRPRAQPTGPDQITWKGRAKRMRDGLSRVQHRADGGWKEWAMRKYKNVYSREVYH